MLMRWVKRFPTPTVSARGTSQAPTQHLPSISILDWLHNERMERIMFLSGLVRDKWERSDYLPRTIAGACNRQFEVLQDKPLAVAATVVPTGLQ